MRTFQLRRAGTRTASIRPATPAHLPRSFGQSLVEFALVAPFLLLVIFGIIDMARLIQAQVSVDNAARQGLRFAVTGYQDRNPDGTYIPRATSVVSSALQGLVGLPLSNTNDPTVWGFHQVDISPPDAGQANKEVDVYVYYNVQMLTPLVNMVIPRVLVRGVEKGINEPWGAVQNFDHANLPTPPPAPPTWTPIPSPTRTATSSPTRSPTRTRTPTNTPTASPTGTPTATATVTGTATGTATPTGGQGLLIAQGNGYENGNDSARPVDIAVAVVDELGSPATAVTAALAARDSKNSRSGMRPNTGSANYRMCAVESHDDPPGSITIDAAAAGTGYSTGTGSGMAPGGTGRTQGDLC